MYIYEKDDKIDLYSFFNIWKESTIQSPSQDYINKYLYNKMKINIIHSADSFHHLNSYEDAQKLDYKINNNLENINDINISFFKIILVRILSFIWRIFMFNSFSFGNSLLIFIEKLILNFHIIEFGFHFILIITMIIMMVSLRRNILKKRYLFYRMIILMSTQSYLRLIFFPNIHYSGFLLLLLSLLCILYEEYFFCILFFCLGSLNSLLSFKYSFPSILLIFLVYNFPKHKYQIQFLK